MTFEDFNTVSEELLAAAVLAGESLEAAGYEVSIEEKRVGFPQVPTMVAVREEETLIVEVCSTIEHKRLERWLRYCRSQASDTRLAFYLPSGAVDPIADLRRARENRFGLCTVNGETMQLSAPPDLAVRVDVPELADIPPRLRRMIARPLQKISDGEWKDGLNDVYQLVEDEARRYLIEGIESGRVQIARRNGYLTSQQVEGMTLGALKDEFKKITRQNQKDSVIASTLELINPTRVLLTHHRRDREAIARIRADVGSHVYAAIGCLEEILT